MFCTSIASVRYEVLSLDTVAKNTSSRSAAIFGEGLEGKGGGGGGGGGGGRRRAERPRKKRT